MEEELVLWVFKKDQENPRDQPNGSLLHYQTLVYILEEEKRAGCHGQAMAGQLGLAAPWESFGVVSCSSSFDPGSSVFTPTQSVYQECVPHCTVVIIIIIIF